jgi:guanylate kinase
MSKIFVLVGGSGVGKSVLRDELPIPHVTFYSTRPLRDYETDGHDIIQSDTEVYKLCRAIKAVAAEVDYVGNKYWVTKGQLKPVYDGDHPIVCIGTTEVADQLKEFLGEDRVVTILIEAPWYKLAARMKNRGDTDEAIDKRYIRYKTVDYDLAETYNFDYKLINDGTLNEAVKTLSYIVLESLYGKEV